MRLLLDENIPRRLKFDFPDHEVYTVRERGWNGIRNGGLLKLMLDNGFDALVTFDKNLQHQQNFQKFPVTVVTLTAQDNTYLNLTKLSGAVSAALNKEPLPTGPVIIGSKNHGTV